MVQVLYIAGYGRSGSTLLGGAIGSNPALHHVGELVLLPPALANSEIRCSCHAPLANCPFWSDVIARTEAIAGKGAIADIARLSLEWESETIGSALRAAIVLPRPGTGAKLPPSLQQLLALWKTLYQAIQDVSGAKIIVDGSKDIVRANVLAHMDADYRVIHLVRDVYGVADSLSKPWTKDHAAGVEIDWAGRWPALTGLTWNIRNFRAHWLRNTLGEKRYLLTRYEDFLQDPLSTLQTIDRFAGLPPRSEVGVLDFRTQHVPAGNPHRMRGEIRLQPAKRGLKNLSSLERLSLSVIAGSARRKYGYLDRAG